MTENLNKVLRCRLLVGGGGVYRRCLPRGVSAQGMSGQGGAARYPPPHPERNDWRDVKTLPCRNFFADGQNKVALQVAKNEAKDHNIRSWKNIIGFPVLKLIC